MALGTVDGKLGKATFVVALYQTVRKLPQDDNPLKLAEASQLLVADNDTVGAVGIVTNFNRITPDSDSTQEGVPSDLRQRTR